MDAAEPMSEVDLVAECQGKLEVANAEIEHLKTALVGARRIGAAIGILMARRNLSDDAAFELLREQSQRQNVKLRELAEQVLYTGELPAR